MSYTKFSKEVTKWLKDNGLPCYGTANDSPEETKARLDAWMRGSKEVLYQWITEKCYRIGYLEQIHAPAEYLEQVTVLQKSVSDLTIKTKGLASGKYTVYFQIFSKEGYRLIKSLEVTVAE